MPIRRCKTVFQPWTAAVHPYCLFNKKPASCLINSTAIFLFPLSIQLTSALEDDSDDETIDTEDTSHNNGDDGLEDEVGLEDTHAADADARLGGTVGSTEVYTRKMISIMLYDNNRKGRAHCSGKPSFPSPSFFIKSFPISLLPLIQDLPFLDNN